MSSWLKQKHPLPSKQGGEGGNNLPMILESAGFKPGNSSTARSVGYEDEVAPSLSTSDSCGGGCWSLDEVMGNTYIWNDQANTLKARDFKMPQVVVYESI